MRVWLIVLLFLYTGILSAEHTVDTVLYDPNGNMKTDQYRSTVLNYDRANQPISITKYNLSPSSSTTYHFGYGVADNRIFKGTMSQAYYYLAGNVYDINADKWEHYPGGVLRLKNGETHKIVKDHLGNTRALVENSNICLGLITAYDYYPFGKVLRKHENPASRFQSTDHEKDSETGYDDRHARLYDDEAFRFMQVDPLSEHSFGKTPYHYCSNNPICKMDIDGKCDNPNCSHSKLTGSENLLIYINEPNVKTKYEEMKKMSGKFDFIAVDNIDLVPKLIQDHYGKDAPTIDRLVVRSHGVTGSGADLDNTKGQGLVHNPSSNEALKFLEKNLSEKATVVFTACNIIMGDKPYNKETTSNFSNFFVAGSQRNLFLNYAKSTSRQNVFGGQVFNFNNNLHQDSYGGFSQFKDVNGEVVQSTNYFNISVSNNGTINKSTMVYQYQPIPSDFLKLKK